jgi:hypothetical protein
LHIVPRIRYLGFTTRGKKGPLTTTGDLSACKSQTNFDTIINRQQWSVELMGETLAYASRKAIKSQILADFVAKWTDT